ncbi:MAG: hypothetical protein ABH952_02455, partial [Candidatus Omnitrophota bacterium]
MDKKIPKEFFYYSIQKMNENIFSVFNNLRLKIARHHILSLKEHSRLKIFVINITVILMFYGIFWGALKVFKFLLEMEGIGMTIIDRLIYLLYFSLFIMLIFSSTIVSYSTAYKSHETRYLLGLPISYEAIYGIKFVEIAAYSSWAFLFFLLPVMFALGLVKNAAGYFYLGVVVLFIPFAIICSAFGSIISLIFAPLFNKPWFKRLLVFLFIGLCIWTVLKIGLQRQIETPKEFFLSIGQLIPHFGISKQKLLPSFWITEGILEIGGGAFEKAMFWWLLLAVNAQAALEVCRFFAKRLYFPGWCVAQCPQGKIQHVYGRNLIDKLVKRIFFLTRKTKALIAKDLKFFLRDPVQWSQFTIFFGLLGIYFANIRNLGYADLMPFWKNLMSFLNLGSTTLTLASLGVRFIFPQFSLEGKNFWILGLAPISYEDILWEKFWVNSLAMTFISLPLISLSNYMLGVPWQIMVTGIIMVMIMTITLVAMAVGLGAVFPNFRQENPAQIVSGFGGT